MDGYHGYVQDNYGQWFETDGFGNYWTSEMDDGLTTEQAKELDEAYSAYETKARTFQQSRQYQRAKGQSRGFYPINKGKKGKGKAKASIDLKDAVVFLRRLQHLHLCLRHR